MSGRRGTLLRRFAAVLTATAVLAGGSTLVALTEGPSEAAPSTSVLDGFDPGDIISDAVMYHSSAMSATAIQRFLEAQQPSCVVGGTCLKGERVDVPSLPANPMCGPVSGAAAQTVAQVIAKVAVACRVNPQVILVMLQKEQTLVTGRKPSRGETVDLIYRKATGLGCPDTAACDPSKYGLFNQLYGVAYWLIRYTTPPGTDGAGWTRYNWFPVGTPVGVLFNPSAVCGVGPVVIRNKATASLYYYTPYQPNRAALAAGWGVGDTCSAYGNRNFALYFTTWFGSTHRSVSAPKPPPFPVTGAISTVWTTQGAAAGQLGNPTAKAARTSAAGGGLVQPFKGGTVYSSAAGTWTVPAKLGAAYVRAGGPGGALGWPRMAVQTRLAGRGGVVQGFQKGTIYDRAGPSGVWAVTGSAYTRYAAGGHEAGPLGWPTGGPRRSTAAGGAAQQPFEHGRLIARKAAVLAVEGDVFADWQRRGAESGALGWPTEDLAAVTAHGATGGTQAFQGGRLMAVRGKVFPVSGTILGNWVLHGGLQGGAGWPRSGMTTSKANGGGQWQSFDGGVIYSSKVKGVHPVSGAELRLYTARGGPAGALGWPGTRKKVSDGIGGTVRSYQAGRVYGSARGTWAVEGAVLKAYLGQKGPAGRLGWPVAAATSTSKTVQQRFQHGTLKVQR